MGKSGYLPDISHNFGFFRTLAVNSVQRKDWTGAMAALYNLNGCLGQEYLVVVSTKKYLKIIADKSVYQCNYCTMPSTKIVNKGEENEHSKEIQIPTEISKSSITILNVILPLIDSIIQKSETMKIWICPKCKEENKIDETTQVVPEKEKPFCIRVVWDCPIKLSGISNRLGFNEIFCYWFWNFLEEINWQEVAYRKEYISQNEGEDMAAYKDKGDDVS